MNFNIIQIILIFLVTFVVAIDQFSFLESLYQPIITGPVIGAILGDMQTGLVVGATYQLMTIGNMPVGGAQPPNAIIGGIVAVIFAITSGLSPNAAAAAAIPFALLGQYGVTIIFTLMSPVMSKADQYAKEANPKGIERINYLSMALLGTIFGIIVVLFFIAGSSFGAKLAEKIPETLMHGLGVAGGMMKFVGFAVLLRLMVSKDLWGFFFVGFSLAVIVMANDSLSGSALLIISLIGFALAFWDYQIHLKLKSASVSGGFEGGEEDGI
ncbi:PTS sugar transporter subunit IIC [Anaerococcus porci]|uniref:PTS sugar transporter subunit IIC n=1 Tax=Anaerococcus porci TaxID=2652269 RepID=A0A6N7VUL1_9FIRM|nr:PTS sugar transporter subunit IIC [Anaerococcus porci]MDY3005578.1 PTS sugar transporter subunit IIC [Anaerococcus porci]MSS77507.1 PTS sugar transporter subunit IIC [Anaerococcus porci]